MICRAIIEHWDQLSYNRHTGKFKVPGNQKRAGGPIAQLRRFVARASSLAGSPYPNKTRTDSLLRPSSSSCNKAQQAIAHATEGLAGFARLDCKDRGKCSSVGY